MANKKKKTKPKPLTLSEALLTPDNVEQLSAGDDVRVRPVPEFAKTFGQGTNTGPRFGSGGQIVRFAWGQPLRVAGGSGLGSPEKNTVTLACLRMSPESFMSEQDYQNLKTSSTK